MGEENIQANTGLQDLHGNDTGFIKTQCGINVIDRFGQFIKLDFSIGIFVRAGFLIHGRDAMLFKAIAPGFDGAPGKAVAVTSGFVVKSTFTDAFNAITGGTIYGAQYTQLHL
jgi:hypothetical protein